MKMLPPLLLSIAVVSSGPALATPDCGADPCTLSFVVKPVGPGPYFAPSVILATDGPAVHIFGHDYLTAVYSHEVFGAFPPVNAQTFLGVRPFGGFATVPGFAGKDFHQEYGFLWGSPDDDNTVTFHTSTGDETYTGSDFAGMGLGFYAGPDNREISYEFYAFAPVGETIDGVTFSTPAGSSVGFEVAAIPEPSTYALLLAGLGLVTWTKRRRRSDR